MRKNEILPFATTWMDLESIILSEMSEEKDKYCMISHTCGIRKTELVTNRGKNGGYQGQRGRRNEEILAKGTNFQLKINNFWGVKKINFFKFLRGINIWQDKDLS